MKTLSLIGILLLTGGCDTPPSKRLGKDGTTWAITSWSCGSTSISGVWPSGSSVAMDFTYNSTQMGISATLDTCIEKVNYDAVFDDTASTVTIIKKGNTCSSACRSPLSFTCASANVTGAAASKFTIQFNEKDETVVTFTGNNACIESGVAQEEVIVVKKK